jgi:hypothetical protein
MWSFFKEIFIAIKELVVWGYKKKKTLKEDLEASEKISLLLNKLIEDHSSDRALIFQFHNGEYFYTGHSIDKMSNTHECVSKGVSREQIYSSNIFTSPYRNMMRDLLNNNIVVYTNTDDIEDFNTRVFFSERGAKSVVMTLMRDKSDRPVGILCMEFVKGVEPGISSEDRHIAQAGQSVYDLLVYGRIKK